MCLPVLRGFIFPPAPTYLEQIGHGAIAGRMSLQHLTSMLDRIEGIGHFEDVHHVGGGVEILLNPPVWTGG